VGGEASGTALVTTQPINFLSMVDTLTGKITDPKHELYGKSLRGVVLVFPYAIGSSVGAYSICSLAENASAPAAIICAKADITTASGCAIGKIPVIDLPRGIELTSIPQGAFVHVKSSAETAMVTI
jgi:predicted aconitase with swiveling domain